ncbi:hypothetical protein NIIDMKKI_63830 [Mycobacterium kansasii]|uniref:Uncharacterized protein n=1 Tax=Mycobacterium kansasii TaxID=1768 RepID=A0A7G1IK72_MYCKA|nr:hypothetical protein NIIDMKKI_63830 [Mycobacterium kansasii]
MLVHPEVDFAALDVGDGLGDVGRDGAGLGVGHQAARAQHPGDATDLGHLVGRRDRGVEVQEPALNLLDQVVTADNIGSGGDGSIGLFPYREHRDPGGLTGAVGQVDGAADHLISLARVHPEPNRHLYGRILLGRRRLLGELGRLQRRIELAAIHLLGGGAVCLAGLAHIRYPIWCWVVVSKRAEASPPTGV